MKQPRRVAHLRRGFVWRRKQLYAMKAVRIYEGSVLTEWDVPMASTLCPPDEAERRRWGWKEDDRGAWYRELKPGQKLTDPEIQ